MADATADELSSPPLLQVKNLAVHFTAPIAKVPGSRIGPVHVPDIARAFFTALVPKTNAVLKAVDGVTFTLPRGQTLGLVGESGSGKSTTGRAIVRLERPTKGRILLDGVDITNLRGGLKRRMTRTAQMVFQDPFASLDPRMTVGEAIAEPMRALRTGHNVKARVSELLLRCGLEPSAASCFPQVLSGGQRQRVAIARALAPGPKLLIADEPVSALDVSIQAQIVELLLRLQEELGLSMVFISHDLSVVRYVAHRIAVMYLGRLVEVAGTQDLCERPLHPYSKVLLSSVPIPDPVIERKRKRIVLKGDVPSPLNPPSGCPFHPRCPDAVQRCEREEPLLKIGNLGRPVACHVAHDET